MQKMPMFYMPNCYAYVSNLILRICQKCGDDVAGAYLICRCDHIIGRIGDLKNINLGCTDST